MRLFIGQFTLGSEVRSANVAAKPHSASIDVVKPVPSCMLVAVARSTNHGSVFTTRPTQHDFGRFASFFLAKQNNVVDSSFLVNRGSLP